MISDVVRSRAPGRVNLIGEHTDYNDGLALPMGLPFETTMDIERRNDQRVTIESAGFESLSFDVGDDPTTVPSWGRYVAGMIDRYHTHVGPSAGFDARFSTTIPVGASLSSSAAMEMAVGFGLHALNGTNPDPVSIAHWGQWVENNVLGIRSGIMDQLISATAVDGHASLVDFRTLESIPVVLPPEATVVIIDTLTRRELVESEYDRRRQACVDACEILGIDSLRDATLESVKRIDDANLRRRARHVVSENARVREFVAALDASDLAAAGAELRASHESLRDDYEVSGVALDRAVEAALEFGGCVGARMTGGGFAGCAVALVRTDDVEAFVEHMADAGGGPIPDNGPVCWPVTPSPGASAEAL